MRNNPVACEGIQCDPTKSGTSRARHVVETTILKEYLFISTSPKRVVASECPLSGAYICRHGRKSDIIFLTKSRHATLQADKINRQNQLQNSEPASIITLPESGRIAWSPHIFTSIRIPERNRQNDPHRTWTSRENQRHMEHLPRA